MSTTLLTPVTAAEYLAFERGSERKHELRDGEIVPMPGTPRSHNEISANAVAATRVRFRGRPCRSYGSDMKVKIVATDLYTYPDLSALCGEPIFEDDTEDVLLNPSALMEVLSPSTENYDRGEKFENYRQIPTLTDYLLIAQDRVHVEHYARQRVVAAGGNGATHDAVHASGNGTAGAAPNGSAAEPRDAWTLREYASLDDVVRIESLNCDLPLRDLYDKVWNA